MRSIIKQIYDGDLCPSQRKTACISKFRTARDIAVQAHDVFEDKLCQPMEQAAFEMAERIRGQYLREHPAPAEGMERIQAYTQAQMIADEIILHNMVYN